MVTSGMKCKIVLLMLMGAALARGKDGFPRGSADFEGQASAWVTMNGDQSAGSVKGLRYLPALFLKIPVSERWTVDADLSINAAVSCPLNEWSHSSADGTFTAYRAWLRASTPQFEVRLGLQKVNFGSATLLRPLMWFDRMDARDPLQLTDGVSALLLRYTFLDNANVWLWGLAGSGGLKGWEFIPSTERDPEYGGRIQLPVPMGEAAVSAHRRKMDLNRRLFGLIPLGSGAQPEDRIALDGKWDIGVGLWGEAVWIRRRVLIAALSHQRFFNLGADYTFGIGHGLHALTEYFRTVESETVSGPGEGISFSAFSLAYPFGLLDTATGMVYYDWKNREWYRFVNCQRKTDNWSLYLIGFWNPSRFQIGPFLHQDNPLSGKGIQLMAVWNH
jgi:hypothetical protein